MAISLGLVVIVVTAGVGIYRGFKNDWATVGLCLIGLALLAG